MISASIVGAFLWELFVGYIKGLLALLLIGVIWTLFLISNPVGWHRLVIALIAVFRPSLRNYAMTRWEKDDEILNRLLGGMKDHTISGRTGYGAISTGERRFLVVQRVVDTMFWFQPHHCFNAINWKLYPADERSLKEKHNQLHAS